MRYAESEVFGAPLIVWFAPVVIMTWLYFERKIRRPDDTRPPPDKTPDEE